MCSAPTLTLMQYLPSADLRGAGARMRACILGYHDCPRALYTPLQKCVPVCAGKLEDHRDTLGFGLNRKPAGSTGARASGESGASYPPPTPHPPPPLLLPRYFPRALRRKLYRRLEAWSCGEPPSEEPGRWGAEFPQVCSRRVTILGGGGEPQRTRTLP